MGINIEEPQIEHAKTDHGGHGNQTEHHFNTYQLSFRNLATINDVC